MALRKPAGGVGLRNNKLIFAGIAFLILLVFAGALTLLKSIYQTETYYVLKADVATRSQIVPEMLEPVTTSAGTAPKAALGIAEVQAGYMYSKYPLVKGDILTPSNVGGFEDISVGVPDEWVVTSFSVNADNAVGGRIRRGVYFDMMVATNDGAFYPFVNVLTLDTTVSLSNASSAQAADTEEAHAGQTSQYVVGMPPDDAARLQQVMKRYGQDIKLVLSPRQNEYNAPQLASYTGIFKYENDTKNMGVGTDYTFTPLKRDAFGRPIAQVDNCSKGNAKLSPEDCQKAGASTTTTTPSSTSTQSSTAGPSATSQSSTSPSASATTGSR